MIINPNLNKIQFNNSIKEGNFFFSARVNKIILDDKTEPELFKEFGEWNSIGLIFFEDTKNPDSTFNKENVAYPLFPNIKCFPLKNELVTIIKLSSYDIQGNPGLLTNYYICPINVWNSNHHNALPDNIYEGDKRLGYTFIEKDNIKTLFPYEGDFIFEGRLGNSFRFTSTVNNAKYKPTWEGDKEGDPLTILVNGHALEGDKWKPIIEDINKDNSSIYMTSSQRIPITAASENYKSYKKPPIAVSKYDKPQIIISSDRILLNSKKDSILLSSKKSININSLESVNIDTKETIVSSNKIFLGDKDVNEPLLLGNKTYNILKQVLTQLQELCMVLPTVGTPSPGVPNVAVAQSATKLSVTLSTLLPTLSSIKSKQNFTK